MRMPLSFSVSLYCLFIRFATIDLAVHPRFELLFRDQNPFADSQDREVRPVDQVVRGLPGDTQQFARFFNGEGQFLIHDNTRFLPDDRLFFVSNYCIWYGYMISFKCAKYNRWHN